VAAEDDLGKDLDELPTIVDFRLEEKIRREQLLALGFIRVASSP
jgi:hypothetical protein